MLYRYIHKKYGTPAGGYKFLYWLDIRHDGDISRFWHPTWSSESFHSPLTTMPLAWIPTSTAIVPASVMRNVWDMTARTALALLCM